MYACAGDTYLERHIVYIISIEAVNIQRISWHICGVRVGGELSAYRFRSFAILRSRTRASPNASRVSRSPFHVKSLRPNLRHKNVWSPETATTPMQNRKCMVLARTRCHYILTPLYHYSYTTRCTPYTHTRARARGWAQADSLCVSLSGTDCGSTGVV